MPFLDWLAGFTDGEGHFGIGLSNKGCYTCFFQIQLREDDLPILQEVQRQLGFGTVGITHSASRAHACCHYRATKKSECFQLVQIFREHPLRAKKKTDFEIWAEAVNAWMMIKPTGRGGPLNDWTKMKELHAMIRENRKRVVV